MEAKNIAAGIVLFNPGDMERFDKCISSVIAQVEKLYIFDNSTHLIEYKFPENITYISEHENKGIAYALNRIMAQASQDGYSWLVTMDQDSILPIGIIDAYSSAIDTHKDLGIICPQVIDL